jgi:hypothetical protein
MSIYRQLRGACNKDDGKGTSTIIFKTKSQLNSSPVQFNYINMKSVLPQRHFSLKNILTFILVTFCTFFFETFAVAENSGRVSKS